MTMYLSNITSNRNIRRYLLFLSTFILLACSSSTDNSPPAWAIELEFNRIENPTGLDSFDVVATVLLNGTPTSGLQPTIQLERGTSDTFTDLGDGRYITTVSPAQTGEHPLTVSYESASLSRTPLVLKSVDENWAQAMAVEGLVNTEGYEDGLTVSPDGQYLFVQTGPQYFSAIFIYLEARINGGCGATNGNNRLSPSKCSHLWIDTLIGPYTAPTRPGFFDGRFSGTTFLHNSNAWGVDIDQAPTFAFATMFYGFKKQPDGSFSEPFYIAFDDLNDAIANPFGMSFRNNADGSMTMIFAHNDGDASGFVDDDNDILTAAVDSGFDIYNIDIIPGQNNSLGQYNIGQPPLRDNFFPSSMINFGSTGTEGNYGTQGNPHLYVLKNGSINSIWTDDEYDEDMDSGDLSVYTLSSGSFPDGNWNKTILPNTINTGTQQIQPFFTGEGLYFTQETDIFYSAYSGITDSVVDFTNADNWTTPTNILQKDVGDTPLGKIIAIGEPSIAVENGIETLYFIYGYVRAVDSITGIADINLQAGYINRRNTN